MTIKNLVAGAKGDPLNSTGSDLVTTVNSAISKIKVETIPTGFNWPTGLPGVIAYKNGNSYSCNIRPEDLIDFSVFTNIQYVDINRPDDSGDGTTWATAERTIGAAIDNAIASGQPTRILVKSGIYPRNRSICNSNSSKVLTAPITIESVYGDVVTGVFDELTYTKTAGQDFVYEAARSNALAVIDPSSKSSRALDKLYTKVDSIAACNSLAGSFYTDNVTVYIHSFNSSPVSNGNALVTLSVIGASFTGNHNVYMSGIKCFGGNTGALTVKGGQDNYFVVDNCSFQLAYRGGGTLEPKDGCEILGCKMFAAFNSDASINSKDGFNLHIEGAVEPSMLTVNCTGFDNGQIDSTSTSNNGITVHDGLKAIDIGSTWLGSVGTNAGHVGDGTQVWHFGSAAGQSAGDIINGGPINYGGFGAWSGAAEVWLDDCTDFSTDRGVTASGTASAYIRDHSGTGAKIGNVTTY